jgi:hypothetical protein
VNDSIVPPLRESAPAFDPLRHLLEAPIPTFEKLWILNRSRDYGRGTPCTKREDTVLRQLIERELSDDGICDLSGLLD